MDRRRPPIRDTSPDQARSTYIHRPSIIPTTTTRKAHIVYYLSRNGQLEHPHFMELHHLPNHHLRLKDITDRLTLLRGKGMPSLFSWSCKRSYKNGYVWNDLSENDAIYPADGAEYVLKGSEIQQWLQMRRRAPHGSSRQLLLKGEEEEEEEEEFEEYGEKGSNTPALSRCSRGIATDPPMEIQMDDDNTWPPSSSSSDKANVMAVTAAAAGEVDSDVEHVGMRSSSMLMQLIACGSAAVKGKAGGGCSSAMGGGGRKRSGGLQKEVVRRTSVVAEDKEYFSGSIVESRRGEPQPPGPSLKKSSSYNERSSKVGIGEMGSTATDQAMAAERRGVEGKCIPGRKRGSSSCNNKQQQ